VNFRNPSASGRRAKGTPPIPWPIFVAGLVCLLTVGIGMFWKYKRGQSCDPNEEAVEAPASPNSHLKDSQKSQYLYTTPTWTDSR
jgi:hypothetical protein